VNTKGKEITMILAGWMIFLSSCEKDIPSKNLGTKVAVDFAVTSAAYDVSRSFNAKEPKPETITIPLNDDYYLSATLVPEPDELRATTSPLIDQQKVRLAAFDPSSGGAKVGNTATYYYSDAESKLIAITVPLEVKPGSTYDFVAYSHYKSTDALTETDIDPTSDDLVWGHVEQPFTDTEAGRKVSITMQHKFFKVKVKVSVSKISGAEITEIGDVKIEGLKTVDLTLKDGSLIENLDMEPLDVTSSLAVTDATTRTSDYYLFYPSPTKVTISSIKITIGAMEYDFSDRSANFVQTLEAGKHYTLAVDLERVDPWAYSNIYWNGSKLTFDKSAASASVPTSNTYQGVMFKWGSLIGVAPSNAQTEAELDEVALYIPNVNNGTWDMTKTVGSHDLWDDKPKTWDNIPYVTTASGLRYGGMDMHNYDNDENYLYENDDFDNYKGDICSYLTGGGWRMPNLAELGRPQDYSAFVNYGGSYSVNAMGTGLFMPGRTYASASGSIFFPASGYYEPSYYFMGVYGYALMTGVRYYGGCWSGSSTVDRNDMTRTFAGAMRFNAAPGAGASILESDQNYAFPIRCVKK
jgi:hypothetical protein